MSRFLEIVSPDSREIVAKKAYIAFRRIRGKVLEYNPEHFVEGKVYIGPTPAFLVVEWVTHKDGQRIRLDISATSGDELSKAADVAMFRFSDAFKAVTNEDAEKPLPDPRRTALLIAAALTAAAGITAYFLRLPPFG
jgi:hypothetical protein